MPRYIDADEALLELEKELVSDEFNYAVRAISRVKTADVVKGVRCLLCEHLDPTSPSGTVEPTFYFCKRRKIYVDPNDCCAFGDRREETDNAEEIR